MLAVLIGIPGSWRTLEIKAFEDEADLVAAMPLFSHCNILQFDPTRTAYFPGECSLGSVKGEAETSALDRAVPEADGPCVSSRTRLVDDAPGP